MAPLWLRATLTIGPWQSMRMRSSRECHDDRRMSSVRPRCQRNARLGLSTDRPARWLRLLAKLTLHLWAGVAARGRAEFALGDRLFAPIRVWGTIVAPHRVQTAKYK